MRNISSSQSTKSFFVDLYLILSRSLFNNEKASDYVRSIAGLFSNKHYNSQCHAKVISILRQTKKMYTVTLKVPRKNFGNFKAGQFVVLELEKNGRRLKRTFSISSPPSDLARHSTIQLSISKQEHGVVTPWLCDNISSGQYLHVSQAHGEFTLRDNPKKIFIAAGSGITPIISMLRSLKLSELSSCTLLYYVRDQSLNPFVDELASLGKAGCEIKLIETKEHGHFSMDHLRSANKDLLKHDAYICGPESMIQSCATRLKKSGFSPESILFESFGARFDNSLPTNKRASDITITYERTGSQSKISPENNDTLLELAENEKLNPLSGCRIGVCHQCVCHKTNGRVYNVRTGTISDNGEEEIQLCVSRPIDSITLKL